MKKRVKSSSLNKGYQRAAIAAGANLGDRSANIDRALCLLEGSEGIVFEACSGYYLTEPVGISDQPWFVNAALTIWTEFSPIALLRRLKELEAEAGRGEGGVRNGPRVLDLDIIFYGDRIIEGDGLSIPHPRMQERGFVLKPLVEIAADWLHPVYGKTVCALLRELDGRHEACMSMNAACNYDLKSGCRK
jgi:2-amino-4-hydroxy-6-hydroxymethyldihydropteridine diphosphokinase